MMTSNKHFGRPRTRERDEQDNPATKRVSVYLDKTLWQKLKFITSSQAKVQNTVIEDLVANWVAEQFANHPELEAEMTNFYASQELVIPDLRI